MAKPLWITLMIVSTITVLIDPARMAQADAVLMMMYGSLLALFGAYFGSSGGAVKKWGLVGCGSRTKQSASPYVPL